MHLLEVAFFFQVNRRAGARRNMRWALAAGLQLPEFARHQIEHLFVRDVSGRGDYQMVGSEPRSEARFQMSRLNVFHRFGRAQDRAGPMHAPARSRA